MANINISFDNKNYNIDESSMSEASADLKAHLSTIMNGTGATINFGGTPYNIDSVKLTDATNDFVSHISTISGSGMKVIVNGVEYNIDSSKIGDVIDDLSDILSSLSNSGDITDEVINYKSETVVLDANSTSLTIGGIEGDGLGYVENRRVYFYDSDCFVVTLNDTEIIIDKTILTDETGAIPFSTDVVVGQYNGIDILCTTKKNRKTGLVTMVVELAEAPTEPISANLTYKTVNVAF